jgi:hypothetical protein
MASEIRRGEFRVIYIGTGDILRRPGNASYYRGWPPMPREGSDPVSVLMVAIGGYGFHYLKNLLEDQNPGLCRLAGVVDPWARQSLLWPVVHHLGVPVCATVEEFYEGGNEADLAVVY